MTYNARHAHTPLTRRDAAILPPHLLASPLAPHFAFLIARE